VHSPLAAAVVGDIVQHVCNGARRLLLTALLLEPLLVPRVSGILCFATPSPKMPRRSARLRQENGETKHPRKRAHCCSCRHILKRALQQMLRRVRGHRLTSPNGRKPLRMLPRGEQTFLTTFSRRLTPSTLRARAPSEHACRTRPHRCLLRDCTIFAWGPFYPGTF
jgi:hypothetical protein